MRFIREVSDLHLDWDIEQFHKNRNLRAEVKHDMDLLWYPMKKDDDLDTTYVIAGDIWLDGRFIHRLDSSGESWISKISRQFKYVVLVLGNHDYWGCHLSEEPTKLKRLISDQGLANVFLLEKDVVVLDQVKFVGSTLWTDYNRHDPFVMMTAESRAMNYKDYRFIKAGAGYRKVKAQDLYIAHQTAKSFIFRNATRDYSEQKVVVVTHMSPSYQSVKDQYRQPHWQDLNYLYYSDLENQIFDDGQEIDFWFHGHMHHTKSYHIGHTNVILNSRGYANENTLFDPILSIEL